MADDTLNPDAPATADEPELVTVVNTQTGETADVPPDAAAALDGDKRNPWRSDTAVQIARLEDEKAALQARIDELEAALADEPKRGRGKAKTDTAATPAADQPAEPGDPTPTGDDTAATPAGKDG